MQPQAVDHGQLTLQPLPHLRRHPRVALPHALPAAAVQLARGDLVGQTGQPWHHQLTDPEVDLARGGDLVGVDQQVRKSPTLPRASIAPARMAFANRR